MRLMLFAATLASVAATVAARAEVIVVQFDDDTPTPTTSSYSGEVTVSVSGAGQAAGASFSDAFYVFSNGVGTPFTPPWRAGGLYNLGFGTGGSASSIDNYVSPTPAYNSAHDYTFNINTGLTARAPLDFILVDDAYGDNTGSYTVSVREAAVPEPATWALMLLGVGFCGATLRRRHGSPSAA